MFSWKTDDVWAAKYQRAHLCVQCMLLLSKMNRISIWASFWFRDKKLKHIYAFPQMSKQELKWTVTAKGSHGADIVSAKKNTKGEKSSPMSHPRKENLLNIQIGSWPQQVNVVWGDCNMYAWLKIKMVSVEGRNGSCVCTSMAVHTLSHSLLFPVPASMFVFACMVYVTLAVILHRFQAEWAASAIQ